MDSLSVADGIEAVKKLPDVSIHLILSDIPYGIGVDKWDVLHDNTNSALLGASPAQIKAGSAFKARGKPLNGWSQADRRIPQEYQEWCERFAGDWLRIMKPGGSVFVFAGRRFSHRCIVAMENAGFTYKDTLAWIRPSALYKAQRLSIVFDRRGDGANAEEWNGWRVGNLKPIFEPILWFVKPYRIGSTIADNVLEHAVGAFNQNAFVAYEKEPENVLRSGFGAGERGRHVAQKPVKLLQALIELVTRPGQVVLDPFCGSGSTLVAAKETGRRYLGFEQNVEMVEVAKRRLMPGLLDMCEEQDP